MSTASTKSTKPNYCLVNMTKIETETVFHLRMYAEYDVQSFGKTIFVSELTRNINYNNIVYSYNKLLDIVSLKMS